jgi:hypothetical protein
MTVLRRLTAGGRFPMRALLFAAVMLRHRERLALGPSGCGIKVGNGR